MRIGIRLAISGLVLASIIITPPASTYCGGGPRKRTVTRWPPPSTSRSSRRCERRSTPSPPRLAPRTPRSGPCSCKMCWRRARPTSASSSFSRNCRRSRAFPGWRSAGRTATFFAAHKLGDLGLEMMEIGKVDGVVKRRVDEYRVVVGDIEFQKRRFENTDYKVTDQEWYKKSIAERRAELVRGKRVSGRFASVDRLCRPDRRLPETPGCARRHHRKYAAGAIPVAAVGRKDRRGVHPRPRRRGDRRA